MYPESTFRCKKYINTLSWSKWLQPLQTSPKTCVPDRALRQRPEGVQSQSGSLDVSPSTLEVSDLTPSSHVGEVERGPRDPRTLGIAESECSSPPPPSFVTNLIRWDGPEEAGVLLRSYWRRFRRKETGPGRENLRTLVGTKGWRIRGGCGKTVWTFRGEGSYRRGPINLGVR